MGLLVRGNSKLGRGIYHFSIPAGITCVGKTTICDNFCYAQRGLFNTPLVVASLKTRLAATKHKYFVHNICNEIKNLNINLVRIHVAGDFYSVKYLEKWQEIVKECSNTTFLTYTRSWRINEFIKPLTKFAYNKNVKLWYSIDRESGLPVFKKPKRVKYAYMQIDKDELPRDNCDLIFRDKPRQKIIRKTINNVLICPTENGITHTTCTSCGICWKSKLMETKELLVSLPVIV